MEKPKLTSSLQSQNRRGSLKAAVVDTDDDMSVPGSCTVWVGGIPDVCFKGHTGMHRRVHSAGLQLASVFEDFGKVRGCARTCLLFEPLA